MVRAVLHLVDTINVGDVSLVIRSRWGHIRQPVIIDVPMFSNG